MEKRPHRVILGYYVTLLVIFVQVEAKQPEKVCLGTSGGFTIHGSPLYRYGYYRQVYENCTYIDGNLEIIFLSDEDIDYDMSFLQHIKEVHGYVMLTGNFVRSFHLDRLTVIRGTSLYKTSAITDGEFGLFVALNGNENGTRGVLELQFKNLREIMRGEVFFQDNPMLCYENTIAWEDITSAPVRHRRHKYLSRRNCGQCHPSCYNPATGKRHCWGKGPHMCQKFSKLICSKSCAARCFGPQANQCCSSQCVGGCHGPLKSQCFSCRNFGDDGVCVHRCPPIMAYDKETYDWVKTKNGKYAYGPICVSKCPNHLVVFRQACVKSCPEGYTPDKERICMRCVGVCPKVCRHKVDVISKNNIALFKNCTIIEDNLLILHSTFKGDLHVESEPLQPSELSVLETVKVVYGYVSLQISDKRIKNLSFLKNLEVIYGNQLDSVGASLQIVGAPSLEMLGLQKLREIKNGKIMIDDNPQLCYADTINFSNIFTKPSQTVTIRNNRALDQCLAEGKKCDPECLVDGCWGPGPEMCLGCVNFRMHNGQRCLNKCTDLPLLYDGGNSTCYACHKECKNSCTGPKPTQCDRCMHVKDGEECLPKCPRSKFANASNICHPCHINCGSHSCTGASDEVKFGGCTKCNLAIAIVDNGTNSRRVKCLPPTVKRCPRSYYKQPVPTDSREPGGLTSICMKCHEQCVTCHVGGAWNCPECLNVRSQETCMAECPLMTYNDSSSCHACHESCIEGCTGASSTHCLDCRNLKVYISDNGTDQFNCTDKCPSLKPVIIVEESGGRVCVDVNDPAYIKKRNDNDGHNSKIITIVCSCIGILVVVVFLIILFILRRAKVKSDMVKMTARLAMSNPSVPLTPSSAQPDLAQLVLAKESELRRGIIIGSGAFGTVYNGIYIPHGKNAKIPVAIKVLGDDITPEQNIELLEEARVMASVDHQFCIHILAVCMTAQVMLITQLVPYGNLLDYIRKNKEFIGSKVLLNWCTQIAQGMEYLEQRSIVHRDLAARNVLVQRPYHIRITDFGLAKLLDINQDAYQAAGGKMPIKWLALECIQHRKFTHKSDVWSYGITLWELFTYGKKPYESIAARDIADLLEKGERLPQPSICTIDVYMIMIKCWMLDADSRPSFTELSEEFSKMAADPGRYLVIDGDEQGKVEPDNFGTIIPEYTQIMEGDRLMRLPSHGCNKEEMMRNMSIADDIPGKMMDAEEYLQPQSSDSSASDPNCSPTKPLIDPEDFAQDAREFDHLLGENNPQREKRYGHLEDESTRRRYPHRLREDSLNTRYSSDPIKQLLKEDDDLPPAPPVPLPEMYEVKKQPINVDENDYLQPQSSQPKYVEVLDGRDYYNEIDEAGGSTPWRPNHAHPQKAIGVPQMTIDNPVYFDKVYSDDYLPNRSEVPSPNYVNSTTANQHYFRPREPSESTV